MSQNGHSHNGHSQNGVSTNGSSTNGQDMTDNKAFQLKAAMKGAGPASNGASHNGSGEEPIKGLGFLQEALEIIMNKAVIDGASVKNKVVEFVHPADLEKRLNLGLKAEPTADEGLFDVMKDIIRYSVKTAHPHFFNQLFGGLDMYGLTGAWLTDALNASLYTYEVSPVFTLMEKSLFSEMLKLIGFPDGDAMFCPGGSMSNMYGINLARHHMFPDAKRTGLSGLPKMCIMTSNQGHYSLKKGAALLGLGMDNLILIKTDESSRMIPEDLENQLNRVKAEGIVPIMVNATAGTTVMGAYDPINKIADICQKHKLWLHVDAAWGGGVLLSEKLRVKMAGVERADSVTWNPHKLMGAPLQASVFSTRHKTMMAEANSAKANYLFQQDKFYDVSYDTGDKSLQCGRKVDVLKVWLMWKSKGTTQYGQVIEHLFDCSRHLTQQIAAHDGYRLVDPEPQCTNVCFWYIPPSLRGKEENAEWWQKVAQVAPEIKKRMVEQGTMLIGYQPDPNTQRVNFFRFVLCNAKVTTADMDFVVSEIDRLGKDL